MIISPLQNVCVSPVPSTNRYEKLRKLTANFAVNCSIFITISHLTINFLCVLDKKNLFRDEKELTLAKMNGTGYTTTRGRFLMFFVVGYNSNVEINGM